MLCFGSSNRHHGVSLLGHGKTVVSHELETFASHGGTERVDQSSKLRFCSRWHGN